MWVVCALAHDSDSSTALFDCEKFVLWIILNLVLFGLFLCLFGLETLRKTKLFERSKDWVVSEENLLLVLQFDRVRGSGSNDSVFA